MNLRTAIHINKIILSGKVPSQYGGWVDSLYLKACAVISDAHQHGRFEKEDLVEFHPNVQKRWLWRQHQLRAAQRPYAILFYHRAPEDDQGLARLLDQVFTGWRVESQFAGRTQFIVYAASAQLGRRILTDANLVEVKEYF